MATLQIDTRDISLDLDFRNLLRTLSGVSVVSNGTLCPGFSQHRAAPILYFIVESAAAALVPTAREEYEAIKCSIKLYKTVH